MALKEKRNILRARARALAHIPPCEQDTRDSLELIEFVLSGESYGLEMAWVREVYPFQELTPLPCAPTFLCGMVNIRGQILAVIDLQRLFGLPQRGISDLHQVIVVREPGMEFGILADDVAGVRRVPLASIQPLLPTLTGLGTEFLRGVTGERLIVLDAHKLFTDPRLIVNEEVEP